MFVCLLWLLVTTIDSYDDDACSFSVLPVFVIVRDLEYLSILHRVVEVIDEALDGVVHLVALLLTLVLEIDDHTWLIF